MQNKKNKFISKKRGKRQKKTTIPVIRTKQTIDNINGTATAFM